MKKSKKLAYLAQFNINNDCLFHLTDIFGEANKISDKRFGLRIR